jgi:hypothetical protein
MPIKFLVALSSFLFVFTQLVYAQKKYDAVLYVAAADSTVKKHKGQLKAVTDSFVTIAMNGVDTSFYYATIQQIKVRKHNGYMRSVFPIVAAVSVAAGVITHFSYKGDGFIFTQSAATIFISSILFFGGNQYGLLIYYFTRNKKFYINNYEHFLDFKKASVKYLSP